MEASGAAIVEKWIKTAERTWPILGRSGVDLRRAPQRRPDMLREVSVAGC